MAPPIRLRYQNQTGTTLRRLFSEAIHCTRKRPVKSAWPTNPKPTQKSSLSSSRISLPIAAPSLAEHLVVEPPPPHPADGEHIHEATHRAVGDAVLRLPRRARAVAHGNLLDPVTFQSQQGGEEAVHPLVELQPVEAFRAEGL